MSLPSISLIFRSRRSLWSALLLCVVLSLALGLAVGSRVEATPSLGLGAQILAVGVASDGISGHMQISRNPNGTVTPWQLQLQAQKDTDYHLLRIVVSPGGYSGWHSHPGLLIGAVTAGQVDFYNARCEKRVIAAGQVMTEDDTVHAIVNAGSVDAEIYVTFLVKHGAPRRRDEPAPACAVDTPIP